MNFETKYAIVKPNGKVLNSWFNENEVKNFYKEIFETKNIKPIEYVVSKLESVGYMIVMFKFFNGKIFDIPVKELEEEFIDVK